ncbi:MAG: hypothetical protein QM638_02535 [Nocardioides sp.]|uniref:hypothetical protein n=1 Tax=Nocardioides sp. TaxID=35761 RepID=UPI0039E372FB
MALSHVQRTRIVVAAVIVQAVVAALTLRDLQQRSPEQVRGPKWLWRMIGSANTGGSVAYWVIGRRRHPA